MVYRLWWTLIILIFFIYIIWEFSFVIDTNKCLCIYYPWSINECIWCVAILYKGIRKVWCYFNIIKVWCFQMILFITVDMWYNGSTPPLLSLGQKLPAMLFSWWRIPHIIFSSIYKYWIRIIKMNLNNDKTFNVMDIN